MAVGVAIAAYLLTYFHYDPKAAVQSPESIRGILLLSSIIPAVGLLLLAVSCTMYGLNEHLCTTMREELTQRRLKRDQKSHDLTGDTAVIADSEPAI